MSRVTLRRIDTGCRLTLVVSGIEFEVHTSPEEAGISMADVEKPLRAWREIAEEASREHDHERLQKLVAELERALDEEAKTLHPHSIPDGVRLLWKKSE